MDDKQALTLIFNKTRKVTEKLNDAMYPHELKSLFRSLIAYIAMINVQVDDAAITDQDRDSIEGGESYAG